MSTTTSRHSELLYAIEFLRQNSANANIKLDYSPASVRQLDRMFDEAFAEGKLRNPESSFAKQQGLILTGVAGYLAEVVLRATEASELVIDPEEQDWYMHFRVVARNGWQMQPGMRVIRRVQEGREKDLYHYILTAIDYARRPEGGPGEIERLTLRGNRPWWKFW